MSKYCLSDHAIPGLSGFDAWLEMGRINSCFELLIGIDATHAKQHMNRGYFWLEFSTPHNCFLGWMRFEHIVNLKNQAIFSANEWRPADAQAPASSDVLLRSSMPQQAGFGYVL